MKKLIALLCVLIALGLFSVCAIGAAVSEGKDQVTLTPRHLYGDPAAAQGATVSMLVHLDEHLLWNITHPLGGETQADYSLSLREMDFDRNASYLAVQLYGDFEYGLNTRTPVDELEGIELAYRELFDRTEPGTKGTAEVRLQDYYTYYPIRIDIDLPGTLWHGLDYKNMDSEDYANEIAVWDAFREFFRIPIPEDLAAIEISVVKNVDGSIGGAGSHYNDKQYSLYAEAAYTSDTCYLTIYNRYGDNYVDTSLIPGGYGIYSFAYENVRNEQNTQGNSTIFHPGYVTGVHAETLAMVYPLDEEIHINAMHVTTDGERMLVLYEDDAGAVSLLVIDLATMTELQTIPVTEEGWVSLHQEEGFFVLFYNQLISVYSLCEDGSYTHVLSADQPAAVDGAFASINTHAAMDFDGERVIFADLLDEKRYRSMQTTNICVAVYSEAGLLYYGEYENSLAINPNTSDYNYNVQAVEFGVELTDR